MYIYIYMHMHTHTHTHTHTQDTHTHTHTRPYECGDQLKPVGVQNGFWAGLIQRYQKFGRPDEGIFFGLLFGCVASCLLMVNLKAPTA